MDFAILDIFSTRELALGCWMLLIAIWSFTKEKIRSSLLDVGRILLSPKILVPILLVGAWLSLVVVGLREISLWTPDLLKDTVYWYLVVALVSLSKYVGSNGRDLDIQDFILDNLKLIVAVELLVTFYTFPFWVELILVPITSFVVMMSVYAETKQEEKYRRVAKVIKGFQAVMGLAFIGIALAEFINAPGGFLSFATLQGFLLPFILSLLVAAPAMYLLSLYGNYELIGIRLKMAKEKPRSVKMYAMWRVFVRCGLSRQKVLSFLRGDAKKLMHVQTRRDVNEIFGGEKVSVSG